MSFPRLLAFVLALALGCSPPPPAPKATTGSMGLAVSLAAPGDVARVTVTVSASDISPRVSELVLTDGVWGGVIGELPAGAHRTFVAQAFSASGAPRYEGRAEDVTVTAGALGLVTLLLQEPSPPPGFANEAPIIDSVVALPARVVPGGVVSLSASAHDPNPEDTVRYAWTAPAGSFASPTQASTLWTAPSTPGPVSVVLGVSDSRGASLSLKLTLVVSPERGDQEVKVDFNLAPSVESLVSTQSSLEVGQQTALSVSASDPEGDALRYQWSATCAGTFSAAEAASTTFTASAAPPEACNNCQLTVTVTDSRGGQNTGRLALCVTPAPVGRAPPVITHTYQTRLSAAPRQVISFEVRASGPAGSALTFAWAANMGTLAGIQSTASSSRVSWTAGQCMTSGQPPNVTATVSQGGGQSITQGFTVTGLPTCKPESWSPAAPMSSARQNHTATLLDNGKVFVIGDAYDGTVGQQPRGDVYDPATKRWTRITGLIRADHAALLLPDNKVLIVGGNGDGVPQTSNVYDLSSSYWYGHAVMGTFHHLSTATLLPDGTALVLGKSSDYDGNTWSAEQYNPSTGRWRFVTPLTTPRVAHTATLLPDSGGIVLVAGGEVGGSQRSTSERYPTGDVSFMGSRRRGHTATRLSDGKVLAVGGVNGPAYLSTAELYDPVTNTWRSTGAMGSPRTSHTATLLPDGRVLVTGGYNSTANSITVLSTAELYDPVTGTWSSALPMSTPRCWHTATLLHDGKVLVTGGQNNNGYHVATTELYDPAMIP